jgi:hypothetical protein
MASISLFNGAAADVLPMEDDAREIRKRCKEPCDWQDQIVQSLTASGWTLSMLVWLPAADALYWFELLSGERDRRRADFDASFEVENVGSEQANQLCGDDREKWFVLALQVLTERGWTRTMLSDAFAMPRTNIIRKLEKPGQAKNEECDDVRESCGRSSATAV